MNLPLPLAEVRACTLCAEHLALGRRPVFQVHLHARILIAGQVPGRKVHETGVPCNGANGASGARLRSWLGISRESFYDSEQLAILPMVFLLSRYWKLLRRAAATIAPHYAALETPRGVCDDHYTLPTAGRG
ncbi:MAG TPA: uracil-DNA glycosylase family protein [Polaromonas sp.]